MKTKIVKDDTSRLDICLTKEQKLYFEKAAQIGGYRTLTEFIITTLQEKANKIINEREQIIASQKDSEIFFNAISNPEKPNSDLSNALKKFELVLTQ